MPTASDEHRVFIVNESGQDAHVTPKTLSVERGDDVIFVVVGEKEQFTVCPESDVFQSIAAGEEFHTGFGSPTTATVRPDASLNSVHRYDVQSSSKGTIDPILIVHEG